MKTFHYSNVDISSGYLFNKQKLNREITINAVYDRFEETGRFDALNFDYDPEKDMIKPHIFWDSDIAKWIESAAYVIRKHNSPELEEKVDSMVEKIKKNQGEDGYFNIYFTVCEPNARFTNRDMHELYCAGHLMEAAVAYSEATGKTELLTCMEKYADYIYKVFIEEKSAAFFTPGHEEIELALVRMYLHTGKKKYLDMAEYFIDTRGTVEEQINDDYNQTHKPVREQSEALGHSVRALYLYTGMAYLATETGDETLIAACKKLWDDVTLRKMFISGGVGSTYIGEAFTVPFDLPNDQAYTETCASIALMFFGNAMLAFENDGKYADVVERVLYNGFLSGLSLNGKAFFYENPLEINLSEHLECRHGRRRFPITQRMEVFSCSCCPPNISRLIATLGNYVYGIQDDVLYVNQFTESTLDDGKVRCTQKTKYPNDGTVSIYATGVKQVAIRVPGWCESFSTNRDYYIKNGYAFIENDGNEIIVTFDLSPRFVWADHRVFRDTGRVCIMRGPILYCAESIDNGDFLHSFIVPEHLSYSEKFDEDFGLFTLNVHCKKLKDFDGELYSNKPPKKEDATLKLIPYNCFANRGETDMLVWLSQC